MSRHYFRTHTRCYTTREAMDALNLPRRTFFYLKAKGALPLVELLPRLGRVVRYQADPIDRWLAGRGMRRAG